MGSLLAYLRACGTQVLSIVTNPTLLDTPAVKASFAICRHSQSLPMFSPFTEHITDQSGEGAAAAI